MNKVGFIFLIISVWATSAQARFLSVDPVGFSTENTMMFNRYAYGNNNPYKFIDPDGAKVVLPGASSTFQQQYAEAKQYLKGTTAGNVLDNLESRSEIVVLIEGSITKMTPAGEYDGVWVDTTISWNPNTGLMIDATGEIQSPSLNLGHEADHAKRDLDDWQALENDSNTPEAQYDNLAEKKTITGTETETANQLGEPTRTSHSEGTSAVPVSSVTESKKNP